MQRAVTDKENKYGLNIGYRVPVKHPLKTVAYLTRKFIDTNVKSILQPNNQILLVNKLASIIEIF